MLHFIAIAILRQDVPTEIPKGELPKEAECIVCVSNGTGHGLEKPAVGMRYRGKVFYLCNLKEIAAFKAEPEAFMPPVLPRPMPGFELADLSGKTWDTNSFKAKVLLVDFWASWCKPCHEMKPVIDKLRQAYQRRGFEVLSVSIDEKRADLDKFLAKKTMPNPVLHDTRQTWAAWNVRSIPTFFLVRDGQIVAQWTGKPTSATLTKAIEAALGS